MNVLLLRIAPHKDSINLQSFMICEPLELEYCVSMLKQFNVNVTLIDMLLEKVDSKIFKDYDIIALTCYINGVGVVKNLAKTIKSINSNAMVVAGGVHAEIVPTDFNSDDIDIILGGGLNGFKNIIDNFNRVGIEELQRLANIKDNSLFDSLLPDREMTAKYRDNYNYIYHDKCATIKTSLGCAYSCQFCFCTQIDEFYEKDIDKSIYELSQIKENNIFIVDDNFLFNRQRLIYFCNQLKKLNINKHYIAFGRADFIAENEDVIKMLKAVGFDAFFVGIESFKSQELNDYNKRTSVEINNKAVKMLQKYDIQCYSGIIVGMDYTKKDFDTMIDYLNTFDHPMVNIQPITPMPGTPVFDVCSQPFAIDRSCYEKWDMAHLVTNPTNMSRRAFYYNILRAYFKTSASGKARKYIKERYGKSVYNRVKKGAYKIAWQYIKLIISGK